jgi:hypothetical protein
MAGDDAAELQLHGMVLPVKSISAAADCGEVTAG